MALTTDDVLPVELTSFTAVANLETAVLTWTTASETNNSGFEVQHQPPTASVYETVAFVTGHGTTLTEQTYRHTLTNLLPGLHRFRLKQIDYDGAFSYSPTIEADINVAERYAMGMAYPNPFHQEAQFMLAVQHEQVVRVTVHDALGRQVALLHDGMMRGRQAHLMTMDGTPWTPGIYIVRVMGTRFTTTQTLLLLR